MSEVVVNVLKEDGTPKTPEEVEFEREQITAQGDTPIVPGSKTDSALLLTSLQETRRKLKEAEDKLTLATQSPPAPGDGQSPTDVQKLATEIESLKKDNARKDLFMEFPILKEKSADFETYLADPENFGMSIKTAAKAFLVEHGLLGARRPGLEKPTGGDRQPPSTGMTVEDIKTLRETNYKKYVELLQKGLIKVPN